MSNAVFGKKQNKIQRICHGGRGSGGGGGGWLAHYACMRLVYFYCNKDFKIKYSENYDNLLRFLD